MFRYMLFIWIFIVFSSVQVFGNIPDISLNYISKSACRVAAGSSRGSGVAVHQDDNKIYVLTNAHVIGNNKNNIRLEFYKFGAKSLPLSAEFSGSILTQDRDFAIISVDKALFGGMLPEVIPLAPPGFIPQHNSYFATAGSPFGRDLMVREGKILKGDNVRIYFSPPPENGQSGSGLFVNIGGIVYVAGIVTAKSGEFAMDNNGYPVTHGMAFNVDQLRYNLKKTNTYNDILYSTNTELYALGDDGNYYLQNPNGSVNVPPGVRIVQWNCPSGGCVPPRMSPLPRQPRQPTPLPRPIAPRPQSPGSSPFVLPEGFGQTPNDNQSPILVDPDENNLYNELKEKHDALELQRKALIAEIDILKSSINQKDTKIEELQNEIELLKQQIVDNSQSEIIIEKEQLITEKQQEIEIQQTEITKLNTIIQNQSTEISKLEISITSLTEQLNTQKDKPDPSETIRRNFKMDTQMLYSNPWIMLVCGVLLTALFLKRKEILNGLKKTMSFDYRPLSRRKFSSNTPSFRRRSKNTKDYDSIVDQLNKNESKIDALFDYIKSNETKDINDNITNNINIDNKIDGTNKDDDECCFNYRKDIKGKPVSNRIRNFFDLKKRDGESIETWAVFAVLYKEAVQLLRTGYFDLSVVGNKIPLQGQKIAADKIDNWVREQFLKRTTIEKIDYNYLYHEAMIGFLYKEAVRLLRTGFFPILGAKETANVLENWVRKEFLNRMGITL
jgi:hypothetical protein